MKPTKGGIKRPAASGGGESEHRQTLRNQQISPCLLLPTLQALTIKNFFKRLLPRPIHTREGENSAQNFRKMPT